MLRQVRRLSLQLSVGSPSNYTTLNPLDKMPQPFRRPSSAPPPAGDAQDDVVASLCRTIAALPAHPPARIASALDASGVSPSPAAAAQVVKRLSNGGALALEFFRWAERRPGFAAHTAEAYHHLIDALGRTKQFALVWDIVEEMNLKGLLTNDTFAVIARRYARAKLFDDAVAVLYRMPDFGLEPHVSDYNRLLDALCKCNQMKRAGDLYAGMKLRLKPELRRPAPDRKTYTILIDGYGQQKDVVRLKARYQEMVCDGIKPDQVTFATMITALCRSGRCDEALVVFREKASAEGRPGAQAYCAMINGLGAAGRLDEALELFEMWKSGGFAPEAPTYNAVVAAYCKASRFTDAWRSVEEMRAHGVGPNARTFDIILHHLIKAGEVDEALRVFDQAVDEPGCEPQLNAYTEMVTALCRSGRADDAVRLWAQMAAHGVLPCGHAFAAVITGLCSSGRAEEACRYFWEMLDRGFQPSGKLVGRLKDSLVAAGRRDVADEVGLKLQRHSESAAAAGSEN